MILTRFGRSAGLFTLLCLLTSLSAFGIPNTATVFDFESVVNGTTSFSLSGQTWTLTGDMTNVIIDGYGAPASGSATPGSNGYMDTGAGTPHGLGNIGGIKAPSGYTFRVTSFDVWPSSDEGNSVYGSGDTSDTLGTIGLNYTVIGKKNGLQVVSANVTDTARTPAQTPPDTGYWHHIDLSTTAFSSTDIDTVEFVLVAQTGAAMDYLAVDNFAYSNFDQASSAPVATLNPVNVTLNAGGTASFTAAATGSPTPTVQWQQSTDGGATFQNISGATSTTLSFTSNSSQNGNQYRAVFTNTGGSATTTAATLTVNFAPTVTSNPTSQSVASGTLATFNAAATGNPTPTVQWQVSTDGGATFQNISGATLTPLSFTVNSSQNGNQYRAVFTNGSGSGTTTAATLTVTQGPMITMNPVAPVVSAGQTANFMVMATGLPTPTVQWQQSTDGGATFQNIPGATSTTLSFTADASQNGDEYRAVFTNTGGSATTTAATLSVTEAPSLVVTTTSDVVNPYDNQTSLREALAYVQTLGGTQTITFASSTANGAVNFYSGVPQTITLTNGELLVASSLTITGPGANLLAINGNYPATTNRVFHVTTGASQVTFTGLTIEQGWVHGGNGGGILNDNTGASVLVNACVLTNNYVGVVSVSGDSGGGIANLGNLVVSNSTLVRNWANNGGAIYSAGNCTVVNSTLNGNWTIAGGTGVGGGICQFSGTLTVLNSTISGNRASGGGGGGIVNYGTLNIGNTILAGNTNAGGTYLDILSSGSMGSQGGNLIGSTSGGFGWIAGDLQNVANPQLGPLADNGGPTPTMALLAGSPAIDAGNNALAAGLTTDQRGAGYSRLLNGTVDIGAFEFQGEAPSLIVTTTSDVVNAFDNQTSLREALNYAQTLGGSPTITFAPTLAEQTVTLSNIGNTTFGPSALLVSNLTVTIDGGTNGVTLSQNNPGGPMRHFYVAGSGNLTLKNLTVSGGLAQGGNSSAGGGAGLGGAIVNAGKVQIVQSTFTANQALGGKGGTGTGTGGGLGGGPANGAFGDGGTGGGSRSIEIFGLGNTIPISIGGNGGFGGGGGGGATGGSGGFGGGAGNTGGSPGFAGGAAIAGEAGGGAGLGGAVFNYGGTLLLTNATFAGNRAAGGYGGLTT